MKRKLPFSVRNKITRTQVRNFHSFFFAHIYLYSHFFQSLSSWAFNLSYISPLMCTHVWRKKDLFANYIENGKPVFTFESSDNHFSLVPIKAPPGLRTSEFRVPSSEFRAPRWGGWRTSEFRVKKKEERKTEGGEHPSQRVANIRVPSKEERKTEGGEHPSSKFREERKTEGGEHPSSEFRVPRRKKDRGWRTSKFREERKTEGGEHPSSE